MNEQHETQTTVEPHSRFSVSELISGLPLLASGFAFMYVVGYFLAFDLAWFAFFSLSEHVVFALRAFPFAIAALAGLLLAINYPDHLRQLMRWWPWLVVLTAAMLLLSGHPGFAAGFLVIAFAAFGIPKKVTSSSSLTASSTILYLLPQLMVMCLMMGWLSASFWKVDGYYWTPSLLRFRLAERPMHIHVKLRSGIVPCIGHVIFVGSSEILFYEYGVGQANLVKWSTIDHIHEFANDDPPSAAESAPAVAMKKSCLAESAGPATQALPDAQ